MVELTTKLNETVGGEFGVEVVDVRVKRIDLPDEVSSDVYNRMRSERDREASKHRSEGKELAEGIRANADRQKVVLEGVAFRESEQIRGDGDAKAARIYAEAYNGDPEFYSFLKSLQAYKASFSNRSDILLIDPNSSFFKYLNNPRGK
jgi:membrane protease subunit HflC